MSTFEEYVEMFEAAQETENLPPSRHAAPRQELSWDDPYQVGALAVSGVLVLGSMLMVCLHRRRFRKKQLDMKLMVRLWMSASQGNTTAMAAALKYLSTGAETERRTRAECEKEVLAMADAQGYTVLHYAIRSLREAPVAWLLARAGGVDPNHIDKLGYSPLHLAVNLSSPAVVTLLIDAGADVSHENKGVSPVKLVREHLEHLSPGDPDAPKWREMLSVLETARTGAGAGAGNGKAVGGARKGGAKGESGMTARRTATPPGEIPSGFAPGGFASSGTEAEAGTAGVQSRSTSKKGSKKTKGGKNGKKKNQ